MGDPQSVKQAASQQGETVSKVDFDAKVVELTKAQQDLEDMRLEVFSPDYMAFLDAKDKGGDKGKAGDKPPEEGKPDFSKMSPEQIYQKAREDAEKAAEEKAKATFRDSFAAQEKERRTAEVAAFARTHEDYETYRPVMYGLSLDPKNKDLSLQELYDKSKEYIQRHAGPSKEEKERQARMSTEKPGGDNQSFEKYKKMSPEETAKESLQEVKDKLGPLPTA